MSSEFIAKFGGKTCPRCGNTVQKGQMVVFGAVGKDLFHTWPCPPRPEPRVVFRHKDGCEVTKCTHGEDQLLDQITADFAASRSAS